VERLYVYWLVSTGLLILAVVIIAVMTWGTLQRQNLVVSELADRVAALQEDVRFLQATAGPRRGLEGGARLPENVPPAGVSESRPAGAPAPGAAERRAANSPGSAATPAAPVPSDAALRARLDEIVGDEPVTPADVADPEAADRLLESATQCASRARWSGGTWARLAVLARLAGQDVLAEGFAEHAAAAGESLTGYTEVSIRALLARGAARDALPLAEKLIAQGDPSPTARVLATAAFLAADDPASADEQVETLSVPVMVHTYDKLLLAQVLLGLEHWARLEVVLGTVQQVPPELAAERDFLLAAALAHAGRTVEALAILDGLAAEEKPASSTSAGAWRWPRPDHYEIEVWRGVALVLAQQTEAARQILVEAAGLDPGRPDAQYYLGLLEARVNRPDVAKIYLKNALAAAPRMVPAWEALASLEINGGEIEPALQHLSQAVSINFRRALAHYLTAIAHAKVSQKAPAAEALRIAFQLDGRYLEEAKQTEVLLNLFTPAELDGLAAAPVPPVPLTEPGKEATAAE
jgi:tetratricopeptide (TPR) repeat protein